MSCVPCPVNGTQLTIFTTANLRHKANNSPNEIPAESIQKMEKIAQENIYIFGDIGWASS